jgi:hypothetical protein
MCANTIDNNRLKKSSGCDSNKKRECTTYKYSNKGKAQLHESVILSGHPVFLKYKNGEIVSVDQIEESARIIKPPNAEEFPYEPYEFANMEEVTSYKKKAENESIDSLYKKAKSIAQNYNDQDDHKLILLAVDTVWSNFQDKFGTTHYVGVIGDNGSGKSTVGDTFEAVGYRVVNMTDPTAANFFRVLGTLEPGQCTVVADEAEKIDQSTEIMSTLKTGYHIKGKVARVNMNTGRQEFFYTYCFKMIIAERSPNERKAKGVLDRTFMLSTYNGRPRYDIKEVLKPAGDTKRQALLDELMDFRKLMLIYRLIHFHDPIKDIDIGVEGRQKELCKPMLQLFHNTKSHKEIQGAFQTFLNAKNQQKGNTIEAALHPIIVNLVSTNGREVFAGQIWDAFIEMIPGIYDEKKPNEFQTYDHGTLYRNTITNIICDKFGAERSHRKNGTVLTFDPEKLVRIGNLYNLETKIQTKIVVGEGGESSEGSKQYTPSLCQSRNEGEGGESSEGSRGNTPVLSQYSNDGESSDSNEGSTRVLPLVATHSNNEERSTVTAISGNAIHINTNTNTNDLADCFWKDKHPHYPIEPSQPSQPSPQDNTVVAAAAAAAAVAKSIYRIRPHSDIFACENCRLKGDKWEMRQHPCKGSKK